MKIVNRQFALFLFSALILSSLSAEGCLFGLFGGAAKNNQERATILGTVLYKKTGEDSTLTKFDSLQTGLVQYSFNGMQFRGSTAVSKGHFFIEGLMPGCCFTVVIRNAKTGAVLGIDSTIELKSGENRLQFTATGVTGGKLIINRDTTQQQRMKVPPRKGS